MQYNTPWWAWLLPVLLAAPWLAATVWLVRTHPRDRDVPPSMAELARRRLWLE